MRRFKMLLGAATLHRLHVINMFNWIMRSSPSRLGLARLKNTLQSIKRPCSAVNGLLGFRHQVPGFPTVSCLPALRSRMTWLKSKEYKEEIIKLSKDYLLMQGEN